MLHQNSHLLTVAQLSAPMCCASAPAHAMTCEEFSRLGPPAATVKQVLDEPASEHQVVAFRKAIADHAGNIAFNRFSARSKTLALVRKNDQFLMFVRESFAMTRVFCFEKPNAAMRDVATEQFNYLLDAVAKRL